MRTLFISDTVPYPPHSGGKRRDYHILRALARVSDVTLLCFLQPHDDADSLREIRQLYKELHTLPCGNGQSLKPRGLARARQLATSAIEYLHPSKPSLFRWYASPEAEALVKRLYVQPFDLVWVEKLFSLSLFPMPPDKRILFDLHDIEYRKLARRLRNAPFYRLKVLQCAEYLKLRRLERRLRKLPIEVAVCSNADRKTLGPGSRIWVVPNGVHLPARDPQPPSPGNSPVFLLTGTMSYLPNVDAAHFFARSILPHIHHTVPGACFMIVGRDPLPAVQRLHDGEKIIVTGAVPDLSSYFNKATVAVAPIRFGGGTRIKILEAMAHRKAVVSTTIGAEGIDGRSGKHFILADAPAAFAEACLTLLRNSDVRERLGNEAQRLVEEQYDWSQIERQIQRIVTYDVELLAQEEKAGTVEEACEGLLPDRGRLRSEDGGKQA
jgi:glycosyltransferase involved in cell wall biosynthesis